jgi:hypothetical protein
MFDEFFSGAKFDKLYSIINELLKITHTCTMLHFENVMDFLHLKQHSRNSKHVQYIDGIYFNYDRSRQFNIDSDMKTIAVSASFTNNVIDHLFIRIPMRAKTQEILDRYFQFFDGCEYSLSKRYGNHIEKSKYEIKWKIKKYYIHLSIDNTSYINISINFNIPDNLPEDNEEVRKYKRFLKYISRNAQYANFLEEIYDLTNSYEEDDDYDDDKTILRNKIKSQMVPEVVHYMRKIVERKHFTKKERKKLFDAFKKDLRFYYEIYLEIYHAYDEFDDETYIYEGDDELFDEDDKYFDEDHNLLGFDDDSDDDFDDEY